METNLNRLSTTLLLLAAGYGIVCGSFIAMYYRVVPNMDELEDRLFSGQAFLYLMAVLIGLVYLPRVFWDIKNREWRQALLRAGLCLGPLVVFLASEGLVSHFLWWSPISSTDQFHMLHHTLLAGVPLALLFTVTVRRWKLPPSRQDNANMKAFLGFSAGITLIFSLLLGILFGSPGMGVLLLAGVLILIGLTAKFGSRAST